MIKRSMGRGNLNMMPMSADDKPRVLHKLQGSIHFEKTLTATTAPKIGKYTRGLVYIFRSKEGPCKNPSPKQNRCACYSARSREKAKQPYSKGRDARLRAEEEGSDEGKNVSNRNSSAVYDRAIAPTPPSRKEDSSHHLPNFGKTLTASNVRGDGLAQLEFPGGFCRKYGNRIRTMVKLQGIHEQSPERTMACHTSFGKDIRHYLKAEWRAFVTENHLHVGQQLAFTLAADSFFVVRERSAL